MLGLYLHIPFCSAICNYCNFNRGLFDAALKGRYVDALMGEIARAGDGSPADTIYFGGGTPSLLDPPEVAAIVRACREAFALQPDSEITLEANPETVDEGRLDALRAAGITRLSFGVQSLRDEELARLSRIHSSARAVDAFRAARAAGFDNVSLDLMMWLPGQSVRDFRESVERLIDLGPDHASLYMLELYPNAPLRDEMARRQWSQAPDDDAAEMYLDAMGRLESAGYEQYEISNVARPGRRARHNLKYWTDGQWLGFGCGAHSTRAGCRWKNVSGTEEYVSRIAERRSSVAESRSLSADEQLEEALFTGLRLSDGVDLRRVERRYGVDVWRRYGDDLQPHVDAGLLAVSCDETRRPVRLHLTRHGMLLAHEVMTVFV